MNAVLEQISKIGIVPVVKIDDAKDALPLAKALCAGRAPSRQTSPLSGQIIQIRSCASYSPGIR